MKLILITPPDFLQGEAEMITALFDSGLDLLHLRKPDATEATVTQLLDELPTACLKQVVVHDFFALQPAYGLAGIHLNSRHPLPPVGYSGSLSRACHSLAEVKQHLAAFDYLLLSPVFDSISKQGYRSAYSTEELKQAQLSGIITDKVMALGGISAHNLPEVRQMGFGGAALLGDVWNRYTATGDIPAVASYFKELKRMAE